MSAGADRSRAPEGGARDPGDPDTPPVALTIAGSDSGGGAGVQADLKTFHAHHVFGTSAVTAVTVQDTRRVHAVQAVEPEIVAQQIRVVAEDLEPAACKSGMLANARVVRAVAESLEETGLPNYVLDPVMVAASGDPLLEERGVAAIRRELVPRCTVVTPNLHETEMLLERSVEDEAGMRAAAGELVEMGAAAALVKGGHLTDDELVDVWSDGETTRVWRATRIETGNSHGTGCTLSSAIAAGLALGWELQEAVGGGLHFTRQALATAPGLGHGNGPLNHWTEPRRP